MRLYWDLGWLVFLAMSSMVSVSALRRLASRGLAKSALLSSKTRLPSEAGLTMRRFSSTQLDWPVERVRSQFVDYFAKVHQHAHVPSSPCVPLNDPSLLFANAGMNQFKPIFLGTVEPSSPLASLKRAVNSQKCIRAGGKHNDLDDVGKDTYHHTFFEMLGTWSFGDYFKKEAIDWAYDILVNVYKLDPSRLYASYFGGDEALGLPCDTEARDHWLQYLPPERVLPFDKKANFWEMGDTGPCGPCSEIHYDRIGNRNAAALVNADDPDVLEIWNLVFIQFNRETNGSLRPLPNKHIDTGMGLERLTSVLQGQRSNYDTDVFRPLFAAIEAAVGGAPYAGKLGVDDARQGNRDTAYRILADHLRTLTFAIADGATPSNEGRGYVLRRILRRAVRYGTQTLGAKDGFFHRLVPSVVQQMGGAFPELVEKERLVQRVVREEEAAFTALMHRGVHAFHSMLQTLQSRSPASRQIDGRQAFHLYDSLGLPLDVTQLLAEESGYAVDVAGFQAAMAEQQARSRREGSGLAPRGEALLALGAQEVADLQHRGVPTTEDGDKYHAEAAVHSDVVGLVAAGEGLVDAVDLAALSPGGVFGVLLGRTPFYAEAGGQVGDVGRIVWRGDAGRETRAVDVVDVHSFGGYVLHTCRLAEARGKGTLRVGEAVEAQVDGGHRRKVAPNHTMTHVLNHALRKVLGEGVEQKGSLVTEDKLRFDFSHSSALTAEEVERVEAAVNDVIREELPVHSRVLPLSEAKTIAGLRAVFGEIYPDPVRVVSVGAQLDTSSSTCSGQDHSIELCGGTHIANTREAQAFAILEESGVAKGVRRIVAVTAAAASRAHSVSAQLSAQLSAVEAQAQTGALSAAELDEHCAQLRQSLQRHQQRQEVTHRVAGCVRGAVEAMQRQAFHQRNKERAAQVDNALTTVLAEAQRQQAAGRRVEVFVAALGSDSRGLRRAVEEIRRVAPALSFLCISEDGDKLMLAASSAQGATGKEADAVQWLQAVTQAFGGRGGGKAGTAQGQIPWTAGERLDAVVEAARRFVQ